MKTTANEQDNRKHHMKAKDHDHIMERIYEITKSKQFKFGALLPIGWQHVSLNLKHAADRLYDIQHDAELRNIARTLKEHEERRNKKQTSTESRTLKGEELEDHFDSQLISVYFLLVGYAIENLLKGILMVRHPEYFTPNAKMKLIRSHALVKLCERCGISLQPEEAALLNKLTTYIEWQGKYPIPLEADKMFPIKKSDGTWIHQGEAFDGRQTQEKVDTLYTRFWNELKSISTASISEVE